MREEREVAGGGRDQRRAAAVAGTTEVEQRFALAVNCTGPLGSISRQRGSAAEAACSTAGWSRPIALGIGLAVDARVAGRRGDARLGARAADQGHILGDYRRA